MKRTSGRGGTRAWPGFTISKPRKLNVRTSLAGGKEIRVKTSMNTIHNYYRFAVYTIKDVGFIILQMCGLYYYRWSVNTITDGFI